MKCDYCGFEHEQNINFCPRCGKQTFSDVISLNPMADRVAGVFSSGLYLAICILISIYSVISIGTNGSFPVFDILFSIFLWLGFAQGKSGFIDHTHIRSLSGTVFAYHVVLYVLSGMLFLLGFLFIIIFDTIRNSPLIWDEIMNESNFTTASEAEFVQTIFGAMSGFSIIFFIFAAITLVINICGIRKIHKFLQSVYKSVEYNQNYIVHAKAARNWLIVLGALGIASSFITFLTVPLVTSIFPDEFVNVSAIYGTAATLSVLISSCHSLCGIFAGALINKHFVTE